MLNLCGSLILSYAIFISVVDQTGNEVHIFIALSVRKTLLFKIAPKLIYNKYIFLLHFNVKI